MSTIEVRAEVHQLIEQLDDKFLNAIHSMLETYVQHEEGYGSSDNPISAEEMKNQLRQEVEENELLVLVVEVDHAKRDPEKLKEQFGK